VDLVGGVGVGGGDWGEDEVAKGEFLDFGEVGSFEDDGAVSGVDLGAGDVGRFGEGAGGEIVGFGLAVLLDGEM